MATGELTIRATRLRDRIDGIRDWKTSHVGIRLDENIGYRAALLENWGGGGHEAKGKEHD